LKRKNKSIDESINKRQNTAAVQTGDFSKMIDGAKWSSKKGKWMKANDDSQAAPNPSPERAQGSGVTATEWILTNYVQFLDGAKADANAKRASDASYKDTHDFTSWNAKRLVWELGNGKSLAAVRNAVSNWCKTTKDKDGNPAVKLVTLKSGNTRTVDPAKKLAAYHELYKKLNIDNYKAS